MNKINEQIAKLEKELAILKTEVNKSRNINLGPIELDIDGDILKLNHKDALEYVRLKGSRLPTKEEFRNISDEQREKLKLDGEWFWSSSVSPQDADYAFVFSGRFGYVSDRHRDFELALRCVVLSE